MILFLWSPIDSNVQLYLMLVSYPVHSHTFCIVFSVAWPIDLTQYWQRERRYAHWFLWSFWDFGNGTPMRLFSLPKQSRSSPTLLHVQEWAANVCLLRIAYAVDVGISKNTIWKEADESRSCKLCAGLERDIDTQIYNKESSKCVCLRTIHSANFGESG